MSVHRLTENRTALLSGGSTCLDYLLGMLRHVDIIYIYIYSVYIYIYTLYIYIHIYIYIYTHIHIYIYLINPREAINNSTFPVCVGMLIPFIKPGQKHCSFRLILPFWLLGLKTIITSSQRREKTLPLTFWPLDQADNS